MTNQQADQVRIAIRIVYACIGYLALRCAACNAASPIQLTSPNEQNSISLSLRDENLLVQVARNGRTLFGPSPIGPQTSEVKLFDAVRITDDSRGEIDEVFPLYWGKTKQVANRCSTATVSLKNARGVQWFVDLRAYDDGVAFRYRVPRQKGVAKLTVTSEVTRFKPIGEPTVLYNTLDGFTTSHESVYERKKATAIPARQLIDCPMLFHWPDGPAAAITEARVRSFAGMYLERISDESTALRCRLSPLPSSKTVNGKDICVTGETPIESPWRVILLADKPGKLLESNLLLCLNDAPTRDYRWARPGKTTFHWWYGEFEDDHKSKNEHEVFVARHKRYIDFCAENKIAYHSLSGDGFAWYKQSRTGYGEAMADADVRVARPELGLPEIIAYAKERGVGMRLWVHWKALATHLEEAMRTYESWGIKGLMVDFLDRDDQEMLAFVDRMLEAAARHKIHIQIHGSSKYSGEQRTFPNLFNREGVLNLEYSKWSKLCTPAHSVNVAYTRALAGPVDYHAGGLRCATRENFEPLDRAPVVMGTRCHQLALFVVYENPMPMVADAPHEYEKASGFEFLREVPTTWDETRFVDGELGEYIVLARRKGNAWYLGGITNWTAREVSFSLDFLGDGSYEVNRWLDADNAASSPNEIRKQREIVKRDSILKVKLATGGGFVATINPTK